MFATKDEVPAAFMQRYQRIMDGKEKLDTIAKLKDFWLFMIDQGNKTNPESQIKIANCTLNIASRQMVSELIFNNSDYKHTYLLIETVADTDYDPNDVYHANRWTGLERSISRLPKK